MKKKGKFHFIIIIILGIIGVLVSYILVQDLYFGDIYKKSGDKLSIYSGLSSALCGEGSSFFNCGKVSTSGFSNVLNLPLAIWGMIFFMIMTTFAVMVQIASDRLKELLSLILFWFLLIGSVIDIALLIISVFVINAICSLCFVTYIVNWISLGIVLLYIKKNKIKPLNIIMVLKEFFSNKNILTRYLPATIIVLIISFALSFNINSNLKASRTTYIGKARKTAFEQILKDFTNLEKVDLNLSEMLIVGNPEAPVTIVEFSDFLCPYCSVASRIMDSLVHDNPEKVKLVFMNYPLDKSCNEILTKQIHPGACNLALGSISADRQGKFRKYHEIAFRIKMKNPGRKELHQIASLSGLDLDLFFQDMASPDTKTELMNQLARGRDLAIRSTPTIFINGKKYIYKPIKQLLQLIINQEYASAIKKAE